MVRFLRITLKGHGYRLIEAVAAAEGLIQAATRNPDVILLDLGLPDLDGIEVISQVRGYSDVSIIVISAREQEQDKIRALDSGADDYLTKPFSANELLARIRVAFRHKMLAQSTQKQQVFVFGDIRIDLSTREVYLNDTEVHLTPIEYNLLAVLVKNAGKVITHSQLLREVWGAVYANQTQYLRVYMAQLRRKLETDPARPNFLINEPGIGYRLKINE
ncbi:MAG: winged helix-turn-helix domain-containing protein [Nitrospirae bacterium]|nr:winged helix-turn-helix domain-containing protein [Nitrospirota bacterium]MBF0591047.1 winged helix-turn-helix domain-containing protein [Nitrospirota bacterium]